MTHRLLLTCFAIALISAFASAPLLAEDGARTVTVAPDSTIKWVGAKVTGDHEGGFKDFVGKVTLDAQGDLEKVAFEVQTGSVYSDNGILTRHLRGDDFFAVKEFPTSTFVSTSIRKGLDPVFAQSGKAVGATHTIIGKLTLRGVTKLIKFPVTVTQSKGAMRASAEFVIDRYSFGIKYDGFKNNLIRREVILKVDLTIPA
ncbi:MAG: YceI family protein [Myxococcota bacterium]